jgi:beta-glucanase (GH16 family)
MLARTANPFTPSRSTCAWAIPAILCAACSASPRTTTTDGAGGTGTGGTGTGGAMAGTDAAVDASGASGDVAPPGWRLVWSDEFEGAAGAAVNSSKWKFDLGNNNGWGNAELEDYTDRTQNAALDGNGNLVITARKEALGGQQYTSARLLTQGKAAWTYGRFEARIQIPKGQGIWPAFWMLGDNIGTAGWPACGEVDIMENIGREPALIHGTMHGPGYSGGNGIGGPASLPGNAAYAAAFHVYAVEWEMNSIRWSVDGTQYFATTPASIPSGTTWVYDHPFFIIMNVAVGGGWPGNPDGTTTFPQTMVVDYVRVYQR